MSEAFCPQWNSSWSFLHCPEEDECANGHHHCNITQDCHDLSEAYHCTCRQGYVLSRYINNFHSQTISLTFPRLSSSFIFSSRSLFFSVSGQCEPVCVQGCVNGTCVSPGVCQCHFGFVGVNCSSQCRCNKHSNCKSISQLDTCLECKNNTKVLKRFIVYCY